MLQGIGYVTAAEKIQLHRFFPPENTNTYQELMQLLFFALFQTKVGKNGLRSWAGGKALLRKGRNVGFVVLAFPLVTA